MSFRNDQTIVSSIHRAINKAKVYGRLNTNTIYTYYLLDYYINFTNGISNNGITFYEEGNELLKEAIRKFAHRNYYDICDYLLTTTILPNTTVITNPDDNDNTDGNSDEDYDTGGKGDNSNGGSGGNDDLNSNTAPTVEGININIGESFNYNFKVSDFITNYYDNEGDYYDKLIIYLQPNVNGIFRYKGIEVTNTININVEEVTNLTFERTTSDNIYIGISFRISDDNIRSLYSSTTTNILLGEETENPNNESPQDIGDNTIYAGNRVETILTLEMFTTQLKPPYNDPENDLIDAIQIVDISNANQGIFYFNNIPIDDGAIITREDLANNLFKHIGPNVDSISTDTFKFYGRDEGSKIWVE